MEEFMVVFMKMFHSLPDRSGAGKPGNLIAQGNLFTPSGTLPNQIRNTVFTY